MSQCLVLVLWALLFVGGVCGLGSFGFFDASAFSLFVVWGWGCLLGWLFVRFLVGGSCGALVWSGSLFWGSGWVGVFGGCLLCALLESLILAQDERWRRA
jgi:hypothetical protein